MTPTQRAQTALYTLTALTLAALLSWTLTTPPGAPRIEEDNPTWNCHTMGNQQCGKA